MNINTTQLVSRKVITSLIFGALLLVTGCSSKQIYHTKKSSLQLQAIQSKEFETNKKVAFASTMSIFQDLGYMIENADLETGLISAKSPTAGEFVFGKGRIQKYLQATAFIEISGKTTTKIRLNFVNIEKIDGSMMQGRNDIPVEDPKIYQDTFEKIQKAIFIRENI